MGGLSQKTWFSITTDSMKPFFFLNRRVENARSLPSASALTVAVYIQDKNLMKECGWSQHSFGVISTTHLQVLPAGSWTCSEVSLSVFTGLALLSGAPPSLHGAR